MCDILTLYLGFYYTYFPKIKFKKNCLIVFTLILFHIFQIKVSYIGHLSKGGDGLAIRGGNGGQHY